MAACRRLEAEPAFGGKLKFDTGDCEFSINDRLLAPNTDETYHVLKPEFDRFFAGIWKAYSIERQGEARELFSVGVKAK